MRFSKAAWLAIGLAAPACLAVPTRSVVRPLENQVVNSEVRRPLTVLQPAHLSMSCERSQTAIPLATPDPLLGSTGTKVKVAVSFIIGMDGRVHSPVILESAGTDEDRSVLDAVLLWRYRPAMCNAVPAEAEAKVEFSIR